MTRTLICGHIDLSEEDFNKYYKLHINNYLQQSNTFYVGGAKGADTFAQNYLSDKEVRNVTVCDKGEQNNNLYPSEFQHKNGFASYIDRDAYMTDNADNIIVFLRKHYMSIGSGSFSNVVRLITDRTVADNFMKHSRLLKYDDTRTLEEYYGQVIDSFDEFSQDTKSALRELVEKIMIIE